MVSHDSLYATSTNIITNSKTKFSKYQINPSSQEQLRVLFVDDEPDIVRLLKLSFEQAGFKVDGYTDPLIALSKFKTNTYDIAILDIKMLGLNALELYERLIQINSRVIVFFLTAYEIYKEALEQLLPNLSKYYFISKPIDPDDLIRRVRTEYESLR
jgi:DNA-binding response OmpR family regulator